MNSIEISLPEQAQVWQSLSEQDHLCSTIEQLVAATLHVSLGDMRAGSRRAARVAFARQIAMYLSHVVMGFNYSEIGRMFGRDRTTAAHACRVTEDRRDDPATDALLQSLENVLCSRADNQVCRR